MADAVSVAQLLRRIRALCQSVIETSVDTLALPGECAPVLALIHDRVNRIEKTTVK